METQTKEQQNKEYSEFWNSAIAQKPSILEEPKVEVKETIDERIRRIRTQRFNKQLLKLEESKKKIDSQGKRAKFHIKRVDNIVSYENPRFSEDTNWTGEYLYGKEEDFKFFRVYGYSPMFGGVLSANRSQKSTFEDSLESKIANLKSKLKTKLTKVSLIQAYDLSKQIKEYESFLEEHKKTPYNSVVTDEIPKESLDDQLEKQRDNICNENLPLRERFVKYFWSKENEEKQVDSRIEEIKSLLGAKVEFPRSLGNVNKVGKYDFEDEIAREKVLNYLENLGHNLEGFTANIAKLKMRKELFGKDAVFYQANTNYYNRLANDALTGKYSLDEEIAEEEKQIPLMKADFYELRNTPYLDKPETWKKLEPYQAKALTAEQWEDYKREHLNPQIKEDVKGGIN